VTDPTQRAAVEPLDATLARIPGLSARVPPRIDPLTGEPMTKPSSGQGALLGLQNRPEDPLRSEIARLIRAGREDPHIPQLSIPEDPPKTVSSAGFRAKLTPKEGRAILQITGKLAADRIAPRLQDPNYQHADDVRKAMALGRMLGAVEDARLQAFVQVVGRQQARERLVAGQRVGGGAAQTAPDPLAGFRFSASSGLSYADQLRQFLGEPTSEDDNRAARLLSAPERPRRSTEEGTAMGPADWLRPVLSFARERSPLLEPG
jgi:hypothetical protein